MNTDTVVHLGRQRLATPLVAASGTVGSVWELARVADLTAYGALVVKSVSDEPWPGRPAPRLAPAGLGMLNGIGIQNPGIDEWAEQTEPRLRRVEGTIWGSAVSHTPEGFARVAAVLADAGLASVEVNLSCPNLDGQMFALDPGAAAEVIAAVRRAVPCPVGAKLSPDAQDIVAVAAACRTAGADWVTLTNTARGTGIDIESRRPLLSGGIGGYSGPPLKPVALRCVMEVAAALPGFPIVGCGGVTRGVDVIEYLMAGASAVAVGTIHFAEPRAARRILDEVVGWCDRHDVGAVSDLIGGVRPW